MAEQQKFELLGLTLQELTAFVQNRGEPAYRGRQVFDALYRQRVANLAGITTLPQALRQQLATQGYNATLPRIERKFTSTDGTVRYLFAFDDGQSVETVWMPEGDGGEAGDGSDPQSDHDESDDIPAGTLPIAADGLATISQPLVQLRRTDASSGPTRVDPGDSPGALALHAVQN